LEIGNPLSALIVEIDGPIWMQRLPMFLSSRVFARFPRFDDMPGQANQPRGQKFFKVTRAILPIKHMDASRNDRS
jgi:hypothetical protein